MNRSKKKIHNIPPQDFPKKKLKEKFFIFEHRIKKNVGGK